jgi:hypothetical protein
VFTFTRREIVAFVLACGAWGLTGSPVSLAADESPLSPETIEAKDFQGKATIEFLVGHVALLPTSWTDEGWKSVSLLVAPEIWREVGDQRVLNRTHVVVSRETIARLKQLGIEDPAEHFSGKVLRVSGTVERVSGSSVPEYRIQVNSLDQLEAIRKP